jgi:hypothetical protein
MDDPKIEVPDQVRDMALRSVEQAEKAASGISLGSFRAI